MLIINCKVPTNTYTSYTTILKMYAGISLIQYFILHKL